MTQRQRNQTVNAPTARDTESGVVPWWATPEGAHELVVQDAAEQGVPPRLTDAQLLTIVKIVVGDTTDAMRPNT